MTQLYVGTKIVRAWPTEETNGREGYSVRYNDGYTSWSPKETFEAAYVQLPPQADSAPEWMQRVYAERAELRAKYDKLKAYLAKLDVTTIGVDAATLLFEQQKHMAAYGGALDAYIESYEAKTVPAYGV